MLSELAGTYRPEVRPLLMSALVHMSVYALGGLVIFVLYLDYVLLAPYFYSLLCAVMFSIPLHKIKTSVLVWHSNHYLFITAIFLGFLVLNTRYKTKNGQKFC